MKSMLCELELPKLSGRLKKAQASPNSEEALNSASDASSVSQDSASLLTLVADVEPSAKPRLERRSQKRAQVKLAARVCPVDPNASSSSEVIATINVTRQSLYFVTTGEWCRLGMRVHVIFPYDPVCDRLTQHGDFGEVTRMERLPNGQVGVAIQLQKSMSLSQPPAAGAPMPLSAANTGRERRTIKRHPFVADAVVVDSRSKNRLRARCADLSLQGCYVDTMNPFPLGTLARVELRTTDGVFEAAACVNSNHVGMGMGLCFQDLTPEQTAILVDWLGTDPSERVWVPNSASPAKQSDQSDRTFAKNLVRDLLARGVLKREDITEIFFGAPIV